MQVITVKHYMHFLTRTWRCSHSTCMTARHLPVVIKCQLLTSCDMSFGFCLLCCCWVMLCFLTRHCTLHSLCTTKHSISNTWSAHDTWVQTWCELSGTTPEEDIHLRMQHNKTLLDLRNNPMWDHANSRIQTACRNSWKSSRQLKCTLNQRNASNQQL